MFSGNHDSQRIDRLEQQVRDLEQAMLLLLNKFEVAPPGQPGRAAGAPSVMPQAHPSGLSEAARNFVHQDKKIKAVKQHREDTGLGLAEAKHAVDAYERSIGL